MEQVGAPRQLPAAQQLARSAPPRVLLAVETHPAADQEHGQAQIRIPAEHDVIDQVAHGVFLRSAGWDGTPVTHRARDAGRRGLGDQSVLAAVAGAGAEIDRLVLPGGVERREVGGVRIGQLQAAPRLPRPSAWPPRARPARGTPLRRPTGACAAAPPSPRRYAPAGRACRRPPARGSSREIFQEQRHEIRQLGRAR